MEGTEKGRAAVLFYRFIAPELHGRKTKSQYQRAVTHVGGGGISVPLQAPEFLLWVSPASFDMPDGEINRSTLGGGAGTDPGLQEPSAGRPVSAGGRRGAVTSALLFTRGAAFTFHAAPISLSPIICNCCSSSLVSFAPHQPLSRAAEVSGKAFGLSPQSLSGI